MGQLEQFISDVDRLIETGALGYVPTIEQHYARNEAQRAEISYFEVITRRSADGFAYKMLPDALSALHRFGTGNENNSKWVSNTEGEHEEYVFSYGGSFQTGQFAMLTDGPGSSLFLHEDHRNLGTYNFFPSLSSSNDFGMAHFVADIYPWIRWGNDAQDAQTWQAEERLTAFLASIGLGAYSGLSDSVAAMTQQLLDALGFERTPEQVGSGLDDTFAGSAEAVRYVGNSGNDWVDYSAAGGAVTISLERGEGFDGWARGDTFISVENIAGSNWGDILVGNVQNNVLIGNEGRDILAGRSGADTLAGGTGYDTLYGNAGDDVLLIGDLRDAIFGGDGFDTVESYFDLYVSQLAVKGVEAFRLANSAGNVSLAGTTAPEQLQGNSYDNRIRGFGGADTLLGGGGKDALEGGTGNDSYLFGSGWGNDVIFEETGTDTLVFTDHALADIRLSIENGGGAIILTIYDTLTDSSVAVFGGFTGRGAEWLRTTDGLINLRRGLPLTGDDTNNYMLATAFDDVIALGKGNDFVYAGGGDDVIFGGAGDDNLYGRNGDDTFVFEPGFGQDVVIDGFYSDEIDSGGDTIEMNGFASGSVRAALDSQGDMRISVLGPGGVTTDTIFIRNQSGTSDSTGPLLEWIRFDDGPKIDLIAFAALA